MRDRGLRVLAVVLGIVLLAGLAGATPPTPVVSLTVLFTHDTHDHFYPDAGGIGGYTRLAAALEAERAKATCPTVTLDAGDFSMGSLFQTIYATDAPELRALGAMGYDATTIGNHEFDYRQQGLADMLTAAKESGQALPAIVQANYMTPQDPDAPEARALTEAIQAYPITPYTVIEKEGVRIGVFGVMGVDSDACAPMSDMIYEPMADAARRVVAQLQEKERPDFIICLSHGGTESGRGEDYELARAVPGIDLIISGHTHTTLTEPIVVNGTPIVSCGPYTQNLGVVTITKDQDGYSGRAVGAVHEFMEYRLIPLDGSIRSDPDLTALAEAFKTQVDRNYLSDYSLSYDGVLTSASSDFTLQQTGDLIGHAYIQRIRALEGADYDPIAFAVAPAGVVRGSLKSGEVTTAQAFDLLSLGSGADGSPGYPLVSVYLTGRDMKNVFEVDASVSGLMPAAQLFGAGSWWHDNPHRMFLDRVTECQASDDYGAQAGPFADKKLYRVVADLYSGQMLGEVKDKSFGLLSITPRDRDGDPITDFEEHIIHDERGRELKAWQAFAEYLDAQDSVAPIKASKTSWPSWSPVALLIPMGAPTALALTLGLAAALGVALLARSLVRRHRRKHDT